MISFRSRLSGEILHESLFGCVLPITIASSEDSLVLPLQGESAGAGSVLQHVVAHGGDTQPPLFRSAMMSSLFLPFQYNFNDTIPEVCCESNHFPVDSFS